MNLREHVTGQSRVLMHEIFERLNIGHINKMEGEVTWNNHRHQVRKGMS